MRVEEDEVTAGLAHYLGTDSLRSFWKPAAEALPGKEGKREGQPEFISPRPISSSTFYSTSSKAGKGIDLPTALRSMKLRRKSRVTLSRRRQGVR